MTIKKIIQKVIIRHTLFPCNCLACRENGYIDEALSAIKHELKEKIEGLRKEPQTIFGPDLSPKEHGEMEKKEAYYCFGRNTVLSEISAVIDSM